MDWLRKTIVAFGVIAVLLFVILIILFIIGLLYLCEADEDTQRLNMPISTKGNEEGLPAMIIDNIDDKTGDSNYYHEKESKDSEKNGIFEKKKSDINSVQRIGNEKNSINNQEKGSHVDNSDKKDEEAKSTGQEIGNTSYVPTQEQKEETMFNFVPSDAL